MTGILETKPIDDDDAHVLLREKLKRLEAVRVRLDSADKDTRDAVVRSLGIAATFKKMAIDQNPSRQAELFEARIYEIYDLLKTHAMQSDNLAQRMSVYLGHMADLFPEKTWRPKLISEIMLRRSELTTIREGVSLSEIIFKRGDIIFQAPAVIHQSLQSIDDTRKKMNDLWNKMRINIFPLTVDRSVTDRAATVGPQLDMLSQLQIGLVKTQLTVVEKSLALIAARSLIPQCNETEIRRRMSDYMTLARHLIKEADLLMNMRDQNTRAAYASQEIGRPFFQARPQ